MILLVTGCQPFILENNEDDSVHRDLHTDMGLFTFLLHKDGEKYFIIVLLIPS